MTYTGSYIIPTSPFVLPQLVMAIDDEMPYAVEALAHAVGHKDTMGLCCFGEQGMNNQREAIHGNLMFGALLFSSKPSNVMRALRKGTLAGGEGPPGSAGVGEGGDEGRKSSVIRTASSPSTAGRTIITKKNLHQQLP